MTDDHASASFDFDVALSFAGEDRAYVHGVAEILRDHRVRVFYDEFEALEMWGEDLYVYLDKVYRERARYTVAFISSHYVAKPWTAHERQSIQARALNEIGAAYLLPVRLDESELPGLRPTVSYIDAREISSERLAGLIESKLSKVPGQTRPTDTFNRVPHTPDEMRELLAQRPEGWEFLLYAGSLAYHRDLLGDRWRDHEIRYAKRSDRLDRDTAVEVLRSAPDTVTAIIANINRVLGSDAQARAFGTPGEPGDPDRIKHLADRLMAIYGELLDWSANMRGMVVEEDLLTAFELAAQIADRPLETFHDFVDRYDTEIKDVLRRAASGENVRASIELTIDADEQVVAAFFADMHRILQE